jgi:tetratricopeptide (TPR) repeat protein
MRQNLNAWQFHWQQALGHHQNNQLELAIQSYQLVLQQQPEFADAHANLAMALASTQQYQSADRAFQQALTLDPDHALNHSNYGYFLSPQEAWHEAERHLNRAVQLNPHLGIAWFNLGNVFRSIERWPEAVTCYERAWPLESTRLEILSDWVFALKKLCRWSAQEVVALSLLQASARQLQIHKPSPRGPIYLRQSYVCGVQ